MFLIKDIIFSFLIIVLFCLHFNKTPKKENLTNTDHQHSIDLQKIQEIINEKYQIDVETIRNLEEIAKKLQTEESLIIPGNLTVRGKLDVDTDGGNVKFGNLNVSNNTNLKNLKVEEKLESKVFDNYSLKDHNHDNTYSKLNHNHDKKYSKLGHNHDDTYSKLKHNHDNTYSKVGHNHDEYAPAGHIHLEYINPDLTNLATKEWVNNKKYVTKDHTHNDLTMTGKLKVKDLEVTNKGTMDELQITNKQSDGSDSWNTHFNFKKGGKNYIRGNEFHIQGKNGGQTNVYGEPIFDKNIKATGNIYSDNWVQAKNLKATGNIYSDDLVQAKRLDIINPTGNPTHFNHNNKGKNYIRGELITDGKVTANENIEGQKLVKGKNLQVDDLATVKRLDIIYSDKNQLLNTMFNIDNEGNNYINSFYTNEITSKGKIKTRSLESSVKINANIIETKSAKADNLNITNSAKVKTLDIMNPKGGPTRFNYLDKGKNYIRGEFNTSGDSNFQKVTAKNIDVDDLTKTKRLSIINNKDYYNLDKDTNPNSQYQKGKKDKNGNQLVRPLDTHFNYNDTGKNYIRGDSNYFDAKNWMRSTEWPYDITQNGANNVKYYINKDELAKDGHYIGFMRTRNEYNAGPYYSSVVQKGWDSGKDTYTVNSPNKWTTHIFT